VSKISRPANFKLGRINKKGCHYICNDSLLNLAHYDAASVNLTAVAMG